MELASALGLLPKTEADTLVGLCQEVGRLINGLLRSLPSGR